MQFYNLKTKQMVDVPEKDVRKRRTTRTTSRGAQQERYAAVAEVAVSGQVVRLYKFVNKETFDSLRVPEVQ